MRRVGAHVLVSILGASVLTLLPWLVEMLVEQLGATAAQAGLVASLQLGGAMVGYLIALFAGRAWGNARMASTGALLLILAFIGDMTVHSLRGIAVFWAASGIGAGLVAAAGYRSAALEEAPQRLYALMMTGQMLFGLAAFLLMPLVGAGNKWTIYAALAALCVVALPATRSLRDETGQIPAESTSPRVNRRLGAVAYTMSASLLVHFIANSMLWSFFDRVGVMSGIPHPTIAKALALSMAGGLAGAFAAGLKLGSQGAAIAAGIGLVILSDLLLLGPTGTTYVCAAILMNFAVMYVQPLYLDFLARSDNGPAAVNWGTLQQSIGFMVGPFVGGSLLQHFGIATFVACVAVLFVGALTLALLAIYLRERREMAT